MPATNNIAPNTAPERIYAIFVVLIGLAVFSSFAAWGKSRFGSEPLPAAHWPR